MIAIIFLVLHLFVSDRLSFLRRLLLDAEKEDTGGVLDFLTMRTVNMESREAAGSEAGEVTPSHSQQTRNTLHLVENTLQRLQVLIVTVPHIICFYMIFRPRRPAKAAA